MSKRPTETVGQPSENDEVSVESSRSAKIPVIIQSVAIIVLLALISVTILLSGDGRDNTRSESVGNDISFAEDVEYTHFMKVYFFSEELGREYLTDPDIINNKLIANTVETYIFAGNSDKGYYVFGDIKQEKKLNKLYFDDPVGGKIGLMKDGWNVTFNYKLLEFLCDGVKLREYLESGYINGEMPQIEEMDDMFIVCIPGYPAFVHFNDRGQIYYMTLEYNGYISSKDYEVFTREDFVDSFATQNMDVIINGSDNNTISGIATVGGAGGYEIDIVALLDVIFDEEHIYHNVGKTSLYVTDEKTGEKYLYVFINTQRLFFNVKEHYTDKGLPADNWMPENENAQYDFRQGTLYLNEFAAKEFLSLFGISMDINDTINITYDEQNNCFTSYK